MAPFLLLLRQLFSKQPIPVERDMHIPMIKDLLPQSMIDKLPRINLHRGDTLKLSTDGGGFLELRCHEGPCNSDWTTARVVTMIIISEAPKS